LECARSASPPALAALAFALVASLLARHAACGDRPQWGEPFSRNQVSSEKNLPDSFDPATGKNIKWVVPLGSETYVCPIVASGRVLIGTNNNNPRDERHQGDRGIMLCLDARDGHLIWQLVVPKVGGDDPWQDWPNAGLCSPATVEGNRVYAVSNRAEVLCLDLNGQADGNDGPYRDEAQFATPPEGESVDVGPADADILWVCDLLEHAGISRCDASDASILINGRHLYLNTSNGFDHKTRKILKPDAPGLVVLDKATGRVIARDEERTSPRTFHCTWSSPSMGDVNGRKMVFFGGGDGLVYAFEALPQDAAPTGDRPLKLTKVWSYDCDPEGPKEDVHVFFGNRRESPSTIMGMPVFVDGRVYVSAGGDYWWGKPKCWLKCIDATKTGDVTESGQVWSVPLKRHCFATPIMVDERVYVAIGQDPAHGRGRGMLHCIDATKTGDVTESGHLWSVPLNRHCFSTPSIHDGLAYIVDCGRTIHCLDAETGQEYWTHKAREKFWSSTLVADGKVYVGARGGDFYIFAAGKEKKMLLNVRLDSGVNAPPTASDGVLYLATMRKLYAIQQTGSVEATARGTEQP
jgi:outer membrane protein assembly factor BamB